MKGRPLAAIGVIGLERGRGFRVFDDRIHPRTDLLHDPKIGVELLGDHLLRRERALVLFAFLEVGHLARQKVIIALQRGAPRRNHRQPVAARPRPAGLLRPGLDFLRRSGPLIAHVDGRGCALKDGQMLDHLGDLGDDLHRGRTGADDAHALAFEIDGVVPA